MGVHRDCQFRAQLSVLLAKGVFDCLVEGSDIDRENGSAEKPCHDPLEDEIEGLQEMPSPAFGGANPPVVDARVKAHYMYV